MSKKKKAKVPTALRAVATIRESTTTDALKVSVTHALGQAMSQSPDWAAATDVQGHVTKWTQDADALDANVTAIAGLRAQLYAAEDKQLGLRRNWLASKAQVVASVTLFCGGSAAKVKGFNLDVVSHGKLGPLGAPGDLTVNPGTVLGEVVAKWSKGLARHGFLVQHATDPASAATISVPVPCTKISFTLGGMPSNAAVSIRVAAIDPASPNNQGPWSAWVLGNAR